MYTHDVRGVIKNKNKYQSSNWYTPWIAFDFKTVRLIMFFHICFSFFSEEWKQVSRYIIDSIMRFTDRVIIFVVVHFSTFIHISSVINKSYSHLYLSRNGMEKGESKWRISTRFSPDGDLSVDVAIMTWWTFTDNCS